MREQEEALARAEADLAHAHGASAGTQQELQRVRAEADELRERLRAAEASLEARPSGPPEFEPSAIEGMEASLIRMSEIVRVKDAELEALKRTVNAECQERVRLLALVQGHGQAAAPQPSAPQSADAARAAAERDREREWRGGVNAKYARKPGLSVGKR